jgi:hypothetical protein
MVQPGSIVVVLMVVVVRVTVVVLAVGVVLEIVIVLVLVSTLKSTGFGVRLGIELKHACGHARRVAYCPSKHISSVTSLHIMPFRFKINTSWSTS